MFLKICGLVALSHSWLKCAYCESLISIDFEKMPPNVQRRIVQTAQETLVNSRSAPRNPLLTNVWRSSNGFRCCIHIVFSVLYKKKNRPLDHCCSHSTASPQGINTGVQASHFSQDWRRLTSNVVKCCNNSLELNFGWRDASLTTHIGINATTEASSLLWC